MIGLPWQAWLARIGSVALVVLSAVSGDGIPSNVRPALAIAGAIIFAVDRYVTATVESPVPPVAVHAPPPQVSAKAPPPAAPGA